MLLLSRAKAQPLLRRVPQLFSPAQLLARLLFPRASPLVSKPLSLVPPLSRARAPLLPARAQQLFSRVLQLSSQAQLLAKPRPPLALPPANRLSRAEPQL